MKEKYFIYGRGILSKKFVDNELNLILQYISEYGGLEAMRHYQNTIGHIGKVDLNIFITFIEKEVFKYQAGISIKKKIPDFKHYKRLKKIYEFNNQM